MSAILRKESFFIPKIKRVSLVLTIIIHKCSWKLFNILPCDCESLTTCIHCVPKQSRYCQLVSFSQVGPRSVTGTLGVSSLQREPLGNWFTPHSWYCFWDLQSESYAVLLKYLSFIWKFKSFVSS